LTTTIAVLGPGKLGLSFVRHATDLGLSVRLAGRNVDHVQTQLCAAMTRWRDGNSEIDQQKQITICHSWESAIEGADTILEALPEDLAIKTEAWKRLYRRAQTDTLMLTGSSGLEVRRIREGAKMPPILMGFHMFVPVHRMRIVELVCEPDTPLELRERASGLGTQLGLRVLPIKDNPGYAASRMALAQGLEAMRLLERGIASADDLDALMVMGYGHPVGPLELSDRVGLDLRLAIANQLYETTGDPQFEAPMGLKELVAKGHCGRSTGAGFFLWDSEGRRQ
jgi:3-hydroxybutyryl-CoA dehydrogenase